MAEPADIRDLVRNFKENGFKFLLSSPGNLRDLMGMLKPALTPHIDFDQLTAQSDTFIAPDFRHLESDLLLRAALRVARRKYALVYNQRKEGVTQLAESIKESVRAASRKKEVTEMSQTIAERLREEGRLEGEIRSRQQTLLDLLRIRFKRVPTPLKKTIEQTRDVEQLKGWLTNFARAETLDQVGIPPS